MRGWIVVTLSVVVSGCLGGQGVVNPQEGMGQGALSPDCTEFGIIQPERGVCAWFNAPGPGRHYETSLKANPTDPNTILVTWTERASGNAKVWSSLTTDRGLSWTTTYMHDPSVTTPPGANPPYGFDSIAEFDYQGNPVVFFGGESVFTTSRATEYEYVYASFSDRMTVATTQDDGTSWRYNAIHDDPAEGLLLATDFMDIGVSPDSPHMIVAAQAFHTTPASAYVFTPAMPVSAGLFESGGTYIWTSADGGNTWSKARSLDTGPGQHYVVPRISSGPDGLVVLTAAHSSGLWTVPDPTAAYNGLFVFVSHDHGATFDAPTVIDAPDGSEWLGLGAPVIHEQPDGGVRVDIVLNSNDEILLVSSIDGGKTWSKAVTVARSPPGTWNWWSIPAAYRDHGLVILSEYSNLCEEEAQTNLRWGMQLHVVDVSTTTLNLTEEWDRAPTGCWASNDYAGIDVAADGAIWAAWSDPRVDATQPQIAITRLVAS